MYSYTLNVIICIDDSNNEKNRIYTKNKKLKNNPALPTPESRKCRYGSKVT